MIKKITKQNKLSLAKLNGEISEGANKKNFFSIASGEAKEHLTNEQAARWLVFINAFDDTAIKPQGKNLESARVGWLGQLGMIYLLGRNLFETLMLNTVLINRGVVECNQYPIWEQETIRTDERVRIPFPDNIAELYTFQSRRIHLFRENNKILFFHDIAGDLLSNENAFFEPMTIWRLIDKESGKYLPLKHDSPRQMWREFSVMFDIDGNQRAGVIEWYKEYVYGCDLIDDDRILRTAIVSVEYDSSSSHKTIDYYFDSLSMHSSLLSELGEDWRTKIETEIQRCEKLAFYMGQFAQELYIAEGGSNSSKDKHYVEANVQAKAQLYYKLDLPFREWLRGIDPSVSGEQKLEIIKHWQETAQKIARRYADELVAIAAESALLGHFTGGTLFSAPRAKISLLSKIKKLYESE